MRHHTARAIAATALLTACVTALPAAAERTRCRLEFTSDGWSVFYKTSKGTGRVECENGQSANVKIVSHGGGITFGTEQILDGKGRFSSVADISDVFGTYFEGVAHAGAGRAVSARGMFKGGASLSLTGKGDGINLGFALGGFTIRRN